MSIEVQPETEVDPVREQDPYRYGLRYVRHPLGNGEVEVEEIPLPREGLLFPEEGDRPVHHPEHVRTCMELYAVFLERMAGVPRSLVLCDCRVDYAVPDIKPVGPDLAVFLDTAEMPEELATCDRIQLAGRPALAVEVTSPDTRSNDFGIKLGIFQQAGVDFYVIIDLKRVRGQVVRSLHGFRNTEEGYERTPLDNEGRLWVEVLGLWLAFRDNRLVCLDGATGEVIPTIGNLVAARDLATAQADAEREQADAAQERAIAAQEQADAERERAIAAQERADAETQRRLDLEAEVQAMRAEIEKLRGG